MVGVDDGDDSTINIVLELLLLSALLTFAHSRAKKNSIRVKFLSKDLSGFKQVTS